MTQPEIEIRRAWRHVVGTEHDRYIDALLLRYAEPHRYYHTATHIMMVLRHLHDAAAMAEWQPSAELVAAALYHDAIYDPRSNENETLSAALASGNLAAIGWSRDRCALVTDLIEATAGHTTASEHLSTETAVMLDADLAILGADPNNYQAYAIGVRAEYFFVDDEHWRAGRGRVLSDFLNRPRIFATAYMHDELEHRARANLEAELATLR